MARDPAITGRLNSSCLAPGPASEDALASEHARVLADLLGQRIESAERIGGGRNSRVYRVRCGATEYVAKFYFRTTADGRDRAQIEHSAFDFLWQRGMRCIPQPHVADYARQVALYGFVDGGAVDAAAVSVGDVDQLVAFVRALKTIATDPASRALGPAAEAFFTVGGVIGNVTERLRRLEAVDAQGPSYDALRHFLHDEFVPSLGALSEWARARGDADAELPWPQRTLSPSDLGFHNALREADGRLVFLDFEYFGWDDPAKTLSDALLHPRMRLAPPLRSHLAREFASVFDAGPEWRHRVEMFTHCSG